MLNITIQHFYLKIWINKIRKTEHTWLLTTESNIHSHQLAKNKSDAFLPKIVSFETGDHCDVKYNHSTLLSKHINKLFKKNWAYLITDHSEQHP